MEVTIWCLFVCLYVIVMVRRLSSANDCNVIAVVMVLGDDVVVVLAVLGDIKMMVLC